MSLSIVERRQVSSKAYWDDAFRGALMNDPVAVLSETLGRPIASDTEVEFLNEKDKWCFVLPMPSDIDRSLPLATEPRAHIENEIYALLRNQPDLVEDAVRDPSQFVKAHLNLDLANTDIILRREAPGRTVIVLPNYEAREELSDEMLDLVSGGGQEGCQTGAPVKGDTGGR